MGQNRISGAAANKYGHTMAVKVAQFLGLQLLSKNSNEVDLNGKRLVIKSARHRTSEIGISRIMLKRVQDIIVALEEKDASYTLLLIDPIWYRKKMRPSRSKSASAQKIMMVRCKDIRMTGRPFAKMTENKGQVRRGHFLW